MQLKLINVVLDKKGNRKSFDIVDTTTGEILKPIFADYTMVEDFENNNVIGYDPMTAKEYMNDAELEKMLSSEEYMAEEKLDGTRQEMHIGRDMSRLFSRNKSKDTGWYVENSDRVPHLREICTPNSDLTVIDGEMRIDGKEFKEVSGTLNCIWDEAIARQIDLGFITLHAFDITYYKGIYIAKMPLWKRKLYLKKIIEELDSPYVRYEEHSYTTVKRVVGGKDNPVTKLVQYQYMEGLKEVYPNLYEAVIKAKKHMALNDLIQGFEVVLDKRAWYEFIVANGGEGLMLKHKDGTYRHMRGREYTKWKKFITRECIIMGFSEPTKEYKGKYPLDWQYWWHSESDSIFIGDNKCETLDEQLLIPISKFYALNWVGNMRFGVVVTPEEVTLWEKVNKTKAITQIISDNLVLEVGECAGYNEEIRVELTENKEMYVGEVVEILANEIFTKTGKLRHPRYLRMRNDKLAEQCIWKDHIEG